MPSSKHHPSSFVSSPAWSLNTLTGTTASGGGGLPVTPVMSPVSLPSPLGSTRSASTHSGHAYAYAAQVPSTPGAPHMGTVSLPSFQHQRAPPSYFLHIPRPRLRSTFNLFFICRFVFSISPLFHSFFLDSLPTPPVSPERSRYAVLSELLAYTGHRPAYLNFNAVQPPSAACLHPSCNPNAMNEPAISTRAPNLLLEVPGVSGGCFYASSAQGPGHVVTVRDVLSALHAKLSERASQEDYNRLPSENHRRAASSSFSQRNRAVPDPAGLRRFDLLGGRTTFAGLQRAANGTDVWHVRFI